MSEQGLDLPKLFQLLSKGQKFDDMICCAAQDLDPVWHCGTVLTTITGQSPSSPNASNKALVYHDSWTMAIWHAYRVTRMTLHTALADIYEMLKSVPLANRDLLLTKSATELQEYSVGIINCMSEEICASIPWCLGQIGQEAHNDLPRASRASLSIAGLRAVTNCIFTHQHYSLRARVALEEVAHRFGIRSALV